MHFYSQRDTLCVNVPFDYLFRLGGQGCKYIVFPKFPFISFFHMMWSSYGSFIPRLVMIGHVVVEKKSLSP